ncbi:MAG: amidase, partial [Chloroflexi bacterium]|nr:amidase [Chloroflexota bacterium]
MPAFLSAVSGRRSAVIFERNDELNLAEYAMYDGLGLAELVKRREVTAKELGHLMLTAVEKVNPQINAVIQTYADRVEAMRDDYIPAGPFAGVPFLLKDIGPGEKGAVQEAGSRLWQGRVLEYDAFLIECFRAAGLSLLGRTTTPEMALSSSTESALTGATRNPWNLTTRAGGSSGGAAASVAAGIVPLAHASDTAGSIRIPAAICGLVGLKPSRGRVSQGPGAGEIALGMDGQFAISRTVRDTAALLDAVSQPAPGDPFVIVQPQRPYLQEIGGPTGKLRIAWTRTTWQPGTTIQPEIVAALEKAVAQLEALGHELTEIETLYDYEEFVKAIWVGWAWGFDGLLDETAAALGRTVNDETLEPVTLSLYHLAKGLTAAEMARAESVYNAIRRKMGHFFQDYDLLLTPTIAQLGDPIGKYSQNVTDVDFVGFFRHCDQSDMYLPFANLTGQPAIS